MSRLLIVEDEDRIASFVEKGLRSSGFTTTRAATGAEALRLARTRPFDLLVLDLGLPDIDGFEVLRRLRAQGSTVPVVILTARDSVRDTVEGFDAGADDYLTKPFRFEELLVRVRARLRDTVGDGTAVLACGDAELDLRARRLRVGGREVELTSREFALAEAFFRSPDQVLARAQLLDAVWGYDYDPGSNVVDVYVGYLRRKLGGGTGSRPCAGWATGCEVPAVTGDRPSRVLVVEDEPRIAAFVAKGLGKAGWDVVVAEDGAVGLFLATTERFDAVVLDLGLPDTDGLEVLAQLRAGDPGLPVIVLTGQDDPASRRACQKAGAAGMVTKPFSFSVLRAELARHRQAP